MGDTNQEMPETYGSITVGVGSSEQRELNILDFIQCRFKDSRTVSVCQLEDASYLISVENLPSSGRNPQSNLWLSKESFMAVFGTTMLYWNSKKENIDQALKDVVLNNEITYSYSPNLSNEL